MMFRFRRWRRRIATKHLIARGDAARDARRWRAAADAYADALRIEANRPGIHVQHGHALKESGDRDAAREAYGRALAIDPRNCDAWLQLGHVLKLLGRADEAVAAYREALVLEPRASFARSELIAMGARDALPDWAVQAASDAIESTASEAAQKISQAVRELRELSSSPLRQYDEFRRAFPVPPPPERLDDPSRPMSVLVDGRGALAAQIRCSLDSLLDQTCRGWHATVLVDDAMGGHPVASMAAIDRRITFTTEADDAFPADGCLHMRAGTILDPRTIEWFRFAVRLGDPAAAYCDHDHARRGWRGGDRYSDPVFQPRFDPFWFEGGGSSPALIYTRCPLPAAIDRDSGNAAILCTVARAGGTVMHVPRLLATIVDLGEAMPPPAEAAPPRPAPPPGIEATGTADETIAVVVPTRDHASLLEKCVATLIGRARFPDRLEIVVVDNRSVEGATTELFSRLTAAHGVRVLTLDEPFNWSRANNLAVRDTAAPNLLLLNNDTEMLTRDWDVVLSRHLARPDVGVVGAKLLYPDRTVQHAGVLFGMNGLSPIHEGVGAAEDDAGPDGRWVRLRSVAAVTGAFMGMRRETWRAAEGFDELALPMAYNDVDMCLKVRITGRRVLYAPDLLLVHHESKTRGHNVTRSQITWDMMELRALHARWGDALFDDPGLNPHWTRHGKPFSAYREPSVRDILHSMSRT